MGITLDTLSAAQASSGATQTIANFVVPSGTKAILVRGYIRVSTGTAYTGITWNGSENFTLIGSLGSSSTARCSLWILVNPTPGTHDIVSTWNGTTTGHRVSAQCVQGDLDTSTPTGGFASSGSVLSCSVTSAANDLVVDAEIHSQGSGTATEGSDQTFDEKNATLGGSTYYASGSHETATGASTTMDWTGPSSGTRAIVGVALKYLAPVGGTTYYILNSLNGDGWLDVQAGGSAPSTATGATGWTVSSTAADNYSQMAAGSERLASTFGGTALPGAGGPDNSLKDAIRLGPFSGDHAAGNWAVSIPVIAVDAGGTQDGAIRVRVWKSANADGSGATELTSGAVQLSTVTDLTTGASQTSSGNVTLGAITSGGSSYYLFFCVAWRITGAAS